MMIRDIRIDTYYKDPLDCKPYNPQAAEAAWELICNFSAVYPDLLIEHVGSSAVPGCAGKGILDILVAVPEETFHEVRDYIDKLGFQKQEGKDPFPESRPMRVGAFTYKDIRYNVHVHIVKRGMPEVDALIKFRDKLRGNPALIREYINEKKKIIASGVLDSADYSNAKTDFIKSVLKS